MQLFVTRGLGVETPFVFAHHGQQLRMRVSPFAYAPHVDKVLSQQRFVFAVGQFVFLLPVCASLLQQLRLAVGVEAREISAITLAHEPIVHLPVVTGLGPAHDDTPLGIDEQSIVPQTAMLALFCARYATVFAH